ncbi:unnamed protein product [Hermetia illucens]|nr:unnamed protein product [Hermetia illucens]
MIHYYIKIKEEEAEIPGLYNHFLQLDRTLKGFRNKYNNEFFTLMKNWDALAIGFAIASSEEDLGFDQLYKTTLEDLSETIDPPDVELFRRLVLCLDLALDKDNAVRTSIFMSNLYKHYGHPVLEPTDGIEVLRKNSQEYRDIDDRLARRTLYKFRETFFFAYVRKHGHYPLHKRATDCNPTLGRCLAENRLPTVIERRSIPLDAWAGVVSENNFTLDYEIDERELMKDTAAAPPRDQWFAQFDQCAFKILYNKDKPRSDEKFEPRNLIQYLKSEEEDLYDKITNQQRGHFFTHRDDIVCLCRKEKEVNKDGRVFCKQTYQMRLFQVALEKGVSDNIFRYIKEQTMSNTELEVAKRMDNVSSSIGKKGDYNINLDLSKWNQFQRHDLNKYIFREFDLLHGLNNCYEDSHHWFNRCTVILGSRLTPPEPGEDGMPLPGPYCHYDQFEGFEGMRQKCWTTTTIMIIKLALSEHNLKGDIMGQGDNQVVHLTLDKDQEFDVTKTIRGFLNTLDVFFNSAGVKLKLSETWASKYLFEYSKIRFYKGVRIDDTLKRLNHMLTDINEGFPSLNSYMSTISACTENISRNHESPLLSFFFYSVELGNVFSRKNMISALKTISLLPLLNIPSIFGGLPISNMYQHSQRGCADPLTIWLRIWRVIKETAPVTFNAVLHLLPCTQKAEVDPISLIEDIRSINIVSLPNFERECRELVETLLPKLIKNPKVAVHFGVNRDDLLALCEILISMRPFSCL